MPNRLLHESITTSDTIQALSPEEEITFYRLMVKCDDFGRFDGRPAIIRAACFPLRTEKVTEKQISAWVTKLQIVGLLWLYEVAGHRYLQVSKWERYQQGRATKSKYPEPPVDEEGHPISVDINGNHLISDDNPEISDSLDTRYSILESDITSRSQNAKSTAVSAPPELAEFDLVLRKWPTYKPSDQFYDQVRESYGHLPLKEEAVKMTEWLKEKRKRRCSTRFVLNWLSNATARYAARGSPNGHAEPQGLTMKVVR